MNTRTPCIILALLAPADSVPANPVLPAIIAVGRDAAVSSIIQWTLAEGVDAAKAYWAGPTVIPYISLVETRARHAEFEKGTGEETQWKQRLASYMAIQPGTKIQYIYETRTRRVPALAKTIRFGGT